MKWIGILALTFACTAHAVEPQRFEITLTGRTSAGPHPNDEAAIRKLVAGAVEHLKVQKYFLRAPPANGGFQICVVPVADGGYDYLVGELSAVSVRGSILDIQLVAACDEEFGIRTR